ncbi:retrovirus-related pol polyprotein from transposon TNT 1-94 [Tanacetum coccineum]
MPHKPRICLRWLPTGRIFDHSGKMFEYNETESEIDISVCNNASASNPQEPTRKRFLNSTSFLGMLSIFVYGASTRGNILITRVYFDDRSGHNLFSVGQFCDSNLEVAFRRNTCFIRNLNGVRMLKGNCSTNLYTINLYEMTSASPICLMARATSTKSWLCDEVFLALGWYFEEIHVTWAHLEKKWTRLQLYTISLEESCSQSVETASQGKNAPAFISIFPSWSSWQLAEHLPQARIHLLPHGMDLTTLFPLLMFFLAQFFPPRRTAKLRNDILMFQQHQRESLSEAWTRFKNLVQKVPHHGIDLWLQRSPTPKIKFASTNYPIKEDLQGKGIKSSSKLLSPKYLSQSSLAELSKNSSSLKRVHFVNSIIILNKEDEAKEEGSVKSSVTENKDHEMTVESEEEFEEETKEEIKEEEEDSLNKFSTLSPHKEIRITNGS